MTNIYYLFSVKDKYFTDFSLVLKRKNLFRGFYGLAYAKKPFFKNSIFTHVSYVSDILKKEGSVDYGFLKEIENTYHVNISDMMHTDRHLLRYKKHRRLFIAQELIRLFIKELHDFNISLVFVEGVDDFISFFAAFYCRHHGICFLYSTYIGYQDRACFSDDIYATPIHFNEIFSKTLNLAKENKLDFSQLENELNQYVQLKKRPSYFFAPDAEYKAFQFKDFLTFFQCLMTYFYDRHGMHYDRFPLFIPYHRLLKIIRKSKYQKFLQKTAINLADIKEVDYLIYPLHLELESSTLIQGRWLNDQRKIIEMISKALPINTLLLVKEHKPSVGRRPLQFYKEITSHHNVFLVDHSIDTYSLIERSKGVVVISSTMAMEAFMLKKPVMAFGERFFNFSSNVYKVNDFKSIDKIINQMINHPFDWLDALCFFYTLLCTSTQDMGPLSYSEYRQKDLEKLAERLAEAII